MMLSKCVATITRRGLEGLKRAMMLVIAMLRPASRATQRWVLMVSNLVFFSSATM